MILHIGRQQQEYRLRLAPRVNKDSQILGFQGVGAEHYGPDFTSNSYSTPGPPLQASIVVSSFLELVTSSLFEAFGRTSPPRALMKNSSPILATGETNTESPAISGVEPFSRDCSPLKICVIFKDCGPKPSGRMYIFVSRRSCSANGLAEYKKVS